MQDALVVTLFLPEGAVITVFVDIALKLLKLFFLVGELSNCLFSFGDNWLLFVNHVIPVLLYSTQLLSGKGDTYSFARA